MGDELRPIEKPRNRRHTTVGVAYRPGEAERVRDFFQRHDHLDKGDFVRVAILRAIREHEGNNG